MLLKVDLKVAHQVARALARTSIAVTPGKFMTSPGFNGGTS